MATTKYQSVANGESQVMQKRKGTASSAPIRVKQRTKAKLEQLLKQANKDRMELMFQSFVKERRGATREEFFGALLEGKLTN